MSLDSKQQIQEDQYEYPYHYIPTCADDGAFSQTQHWSWGFRYLGGLLVAQELCEAEPFTSLVDVGCGDGRFLAQINKALPDIRTKGVDYSDRAIHLAKSLNPTIDFEARDITKSLPTENDRYDVLTLIEVIEHIPPADLPCFLKACANRVRSGGRIIITVPHANKPLNPKHYQHFNSTMITDVLPPEAEVLGFKFFDRRSKVVTALSYLLGGNGDNFVVTNKLLNRKFFEFYRKNGLYAKTEQDCMRIACMVRIR